MVFGRRKRVRVGRRRGVGCILEMGLEEVLVFGWEDSGVGMMVVKGFWIYEVRLTTCLGAFR